MNPVANEPSTPGDDLDQLLRAYYRAELPSPWPRFQSPSRSRLLPLRPRASAWLSRAALVAAAVMLLTALALMPRTSSTGSERPGIIRTIGPGSARPGVLPAPAGSLDKSSGQPDDGQTGLKGDEELTPDR